MDESVLSNNGLDQDKCEAFIMKHEEYQEILKELFAQTRYFSKDDVINGMRSLIFDIMHLLPMKLFWVSQTCGSEQWCFNNLKHLLPPTTPITSLLEEEIDASEKIPTILFLDDWILSGHRMMGSIEDILQVGERIGNDYLARIRYTEKKVNLVIISFINTENAISELKSLIRYYPNVQKLDVYYSVLVERFKPFSEFTSEISEKFLKEFQLDFDFPVHLEYKLYNKFGCFSTIYEYVRKSPIIPCYISKPLDKALL